MPAEKNAHSTEKVSAYVCVLFAIVVVGTGLGGMTQTALNTVAAVVLADLGADIGWGQWLTTIYIFSMGAAVPLASFLQRKFSIRSLMLIAYGLYLVGSLCDFMAMTFPMLIIGRVLEAVGTGILMPLLQTIAMTRFPEGRHGTAMGFAGISLGFAPNIGPTIGGFLCDALGWRFMFLILVATSAILLALTLFVVRDREAADSHATLDWLSLVLSTFGMGSLLLGFTAAANMSVLEPLVWLPLIIGIACIILFLKRQGKLARPLIDLRIFAHAHYRVSLLTQCLLYACFVGMTLIIPLALIDGAGHTALEAGIVLFPGAFAALIFEPAAGMATDRFGARKVAIFGGIMLALGAMLIAFVPLDAPLWIPALLQTLRCIGLTSLIPTTTAYGLGSLANEGITPDGSATLIMSRQCSASLATAVMVFLITMAATLDMPLMGYHWALGFSGVMGVLTLACCLAFIGRKHG